MGFEASKAEEKFMRPLMEVTIPWGKIIWVHRQLPLNLHVRIQYLGCLHHC